MGASAAAAIIVRKERDLVEMFIRAGATSPVAARTLNELNVHHEGLALRRLRNRAVVREADRGYYVDLQSWEAFRRTRHRILLVVLVLVVIVAVGSAIGFVNR